MAITINSAATNNADWKTQFEFTDSDSGDLIDFTDASIKIDVRDQDNCQKLSASIDDGKIVITGTGIFEMTIPASEMVGLCPGSYKIGGVYAVNGETVALFVGSLTVIDGVAFL